jgi:hypothetical protein
MHIIVLEQEPSSRRGGQEVVLLDFAVVCLSVDIVLVYFIIKKEFTRAISRVLYRRNKSY